MPTDEERERELREVLGNHLVPGANFTTWPNLKWARAKVHLAALSTSFEEWQASAPIIIEGVLRDDGETVDLIMRVPRGIPGHEWSLSLGDAIHNLRSAFDAVAWGMAHHNEAAPRRPKQVSFPVALDVDQWDRAVAAWIGDIDPEYQHRIAIMQPYTFAPPGADTFLSILTDLDNRDKHRNLIDVSANIDQIDLSGSFAYADRNTPATPRLELHSIGGIRDGAVVATIHAGAAVEPPVIMRLVPTCKMTLTHNEQTHEVVTFAEGLLNETRRCLDILIRGLAPADDGAGEWSPMDVSGAPPTPA